MRMEIAGLTVAVNRLNAVRLALEAKTWMAFQTRKAGLVGGGVARAATPKRDACGRYVVDLLSIPTCAGMPPIFSA